jgi:hypothetical protein
MRNTLLALAIACMSPTLMGAGSLSQAIVVAVRVDQTGNGIVFFDRNLTGTPPGCVQSTYQNALAFNSNNAGGKAVLALALSSKAMGAPISVVGLGTCSVFGSAVEDWDYGVAQ